MQASESAAKRTIHGNHDRLQFTESVLAFYWVSYEPDLAVSVLFNLSIDILHDVQCDVIVQESGLRLKERYWVTILGFENVHINREKHHLRAESIKALRMT